MNDSFKKKLEDIGEINTLNILVSIIIPVYNGSRHINSIIKCFDNQIYRHFELIFVNDGSKDDSYSILQNLKEISNLRIEIVNQENQGVSAARNKGISIANGDYICFCDVDDEVTTNYISELLRTITSQNVDLVICKSILKRINGKTDIRTTNDTGKITIKNTISCLQDFLYGRIKSGCWTIITKKTLIIDNNLFFATGYKYSEDLHMLWRIIALSKSIAYLDKSLYIYKLQEYSATSYFNNDRLQGYVLFKGLEAFFETKMKPFASEFKKYGAARIMWSITWQASVNYNSEQFMKFIIEHSVKGEMKKLILFKEIKVAITSGIFLLSPSLFKFISNRYGSRYIH